MVLTAQLHTRTHTVIDYKAIPLRTKFLFLFFSSSSSRHAYNLAKQFDQQKQTITNISQIFSPSIETIRLELVDAATTLIYQTEYEAFAKKSREILWFKGYYDLASLAKRFWKRNGEKPGHDPLLEGQLSNLIIEGIAHFKTIVVRLEHEHALDLRHTVDFSFIDTFEKNILLSAAVKINGIGNGHHDMVGDSNSSNGSQNEMQRRDSHEMNRYALETIHALLISLGDLHRYFIEFNFNMPKISKDFASNYYFEAFKLNPKMGMAHNQLGTLFSGQNNDLNSIYHYLYSLVCAVPFELSDVNVTKLFQSNADYLGQCGQNDKFDEIVVRDAIARFILVADVFFYDKDIVDLNSLCHCTLIDARELLRARQPDGPPDMFFKMVAILFFCLAKLKMIGSAKVHHLNAFLLAICAEMVSACTVKLEAHLGKKQKQIDHFAVEYGDAFDGFERNVRVARENHRRFVEQTKSENGSGDAGNGRDDHGLPLNGHVKLASRNVQNGETKLNFGKSDGSERETDGHGGSSSGQLRSAGGEQKSSASQKISKKKQLKVRRRRKRVSSDQSESEMSNSDYDMDSDFSTDTESDDYDDDDDDDMNSCYSTDFDEENADVATGHKSDDDDIVIEEEELIYLNGNGTLATEQSQQQQQENAFGFSDDELCNGFNTLKFNCTDAGEDAIAEPDHPINGDCDEDAHAAPEKLRYKQKYEKIDPNIIIEFMSSEFSAQPMRILFDWLHINSDILINCFATNPEFIDKIFALLNLINIDIFTRKVYFHRRFIKAANVRENLRSLFDDRTTIPLAEDVLLKEFHLFDQSQNQLDWTLPSKLGTTAAEENILRVFRLIDFGFSVCKIKKFRYNFCSRTRKFLRDEDVVRKRQRKRGRNSNRKRRQRERRGGRRRDGAPRTRDESRQCRTGGGSSNEDHDDAERKNGGLRKGYLKSKVNMLANGVKLAVDCDVKQNSGQPLRGDKHEIMGKLWLQHEIQNLEAKMSKQPLILTPYLVVDTKAMTNHLPIVKNLVKSKQFVVLIPNAGKATRFSIPMTFHLCR